MQERKKAPLFALWEFPTGASVLAKAARFKCCEIHKLNVLLLARRAH